MYGHAHELSQLAVFAWNPPINSSENVKKVYAPDFPPFVAGRLFDVGNHNCVAFSGIATDRHERRPGQRGQVCPRHESQHRGHGRLPQVIIKKRTRKQGQAPGNRNGPDRVQRIPAVAQQAPVKIQNEIIPQTASVCRNCPLSPRERRLRACPE